jgi:hypothetical protein
MKESVKGGFYFDEAFPRDNSAAVGPNEGGSGRGSVKPKTGEAYGSRSKHKVGMDEMGEGSSNHA